MRVIVARCEVEYRGRLRTRLPEAVRMVLVKGDGSVQIHADYGGYKPLNWMSPPTAIEEQPGLLRVRRVRGPDEEIEVRIAEILADHEFPLDAESKLEKDGVEAELQRLLAHDPTSLGEGFLLVRREWATDIGPVDLLCRDADGGYVAVEIKRVATTEAVDQLTRYLERINADPQLRPCRGVLAACAIKPQARALAESRGIVCAEIDLARLRGERNPELRLFAA